MSLSGVTGAYSGCCGHASGIPAVSVTARMSPLPAMASSSSSPLAQEPPEECGTVVVTEDSGSDGLLCDEAGACEAGHHCVCCCAGEGPDCGLLGLEISLARGVEDLNAVSDALDRARSAANVVLLSRGDNGSTKKPSIP